MRLADVLAGVEARPTDVRSGQPQGTGLPAAQGGPTVQDVADLEIRAVTADSRQVQPGTLFVAVRGTHLDGNQFLAAAAQAGAAAALTDLPERTGWLEVNGHRCPVLPVADARRALAWAAANFYGRPAQHLQVVGVTGTLGKTSVSHLLFAILAQAGVEWRPGLIGSLGIRWADVYRPSPLTTPDALTLQKTLDEMVRAKVRVPILEVSSHAQLQQRVEGISFAAAALLCLVPGEHADIHPDFAHYVQVKAKILAELQQGAPFVYNLGDPRVARLLRSSARSGVLGDLRHPEQWPYVPVGYQGLDAISLVANPWLTPEAKSAGAAGKSAEWDGLLTAHGLVQLREPELTQNGSRFRIVSAAPLWTVNRNWRDPVDFVCSLPLLGLHNVANAMAAVATALTLGVSPEAIQAGLAQAKPFRRRMEVIHRGEFTVIDDTTGHPASFAALFHVVRLWHPRRVLLLTSVRGQRGVAINRANALAVAQGVATLPVAHLVVTAAYDCPSPQHHPTPEETAAFIDTLRGQSVKYEFAPDLVGALRRLLDRVRPGDLVLLAGTQNLDQAAPLLQQLIQA
ncbi:MAG: hypothetical protein IMX01_07595 [Limnochordaceae bacterium]|nr:hypothetical protein [Limnochordaceae bacterium]